MNGERVDDDRHHAIDAIVLAATSESMLQRLTRAFQRAEREGRPQAFKAFDPPWPLFRDDVKRARDGIFVARAERCRARGEAHAATIRQIAERDGRELIFERKPVNEKFTAQDLLRIKDPERNAAYVQAIRAWLDAGKPKDQLSRSPRGDVIRGAAAHQQERGCRGARRRRRSREMARVDVFRKKTPKGAWQYFLVPVYPHQIATLDEPPMRAVTAHKLETSWPVMDCSAEFLWSVTHLQLVRLFDHFVRGDAADRRNRLLDYGYAVVRAALARALIACGLLPCIGLQHARASNAFNLADDLLEPFRPFVDRLASGLAGATEGTEGPEGGGVSLQDRRALAGILTVDAPVGDERVSLLLAAETAAASLVRAFESRSLALILLPHLDADG